MNSFIFAVLWVMLYFGIASAQTDVIPDRENCLLCHRYPHIGRYDKTGQKRIFYVNENLFARSVHGKLSCKSCHVGLDAIPHVDVPKVDCSIKCHITEPSTEREFSHINMVDKYKTSVHGMVNEGKAKPHPEDLPTCKYCHQNSMYKPYEGVWGKSEALSHETLSRCKGCHTKEQWAERYYSHFTNRMRHRRSQTEIIALCASCHEDQEKMARHGLESIETYKDTFHWTQVKSQNANAPDCMSCHVPIGYTSHDIRPQTDTLSPVNMDNRVSTCSNQGGLQTCHPGAKAAFASGRVHAYGIKTRMAAGKEIDETANKNMSLVRKRAEAEISEHEIFHYKILQLIQLFYKLLIGGVIGFMCLHQMLHYFRARKNHARSH